MPPAVVAVLPPASVLHPVSVLHPPSALPTYGVYSAPLFLCCPPPGPWTRWRKAMFSFSSGTSSTCAHVPSCGAPRVAVPPHVPSCRASRGCTATWLGTATWCTAAPSGRVPHGMERTKASANSPSALAVCPAGCFSSSGSALPDGEVDIELRCAAVGAALRPVWRRARCSRKRRGSPQSSSRGRSSSRGQGVARRSGGGACPGGCQHALSARMPRNLSGRRCRRPVFACPKP